MSVDSGHGRIVQALEDGRRALGRARLTAGLLRFVGIALATLAGLLLWAALQRVLRFYSVPVATLASVLGAGMVVFALVRWVIVPLIRLPGRDDFVRLVESRYPHEKNVIVNAYQLGDPSQSSRHAGSEDLVEAVVDRAVRRVKDLDLHKWRDPAPDRPFLWAGGAALAVILALGLISPALMTGALGQILRPSRAEAPPVTLVVQPGEVEVDRGIDVPVSVRVEGTGKAPTLRFRERNGEWRVRDFTPAGPGAVTRDAGRWDSVLPSVDRDLEYQVQAPRAESEIFAIRVKEPPRIAGFRVHLRYPDYSGLAAETLEGGSGDIAALKGTAVDLRILTNRPLGSGYLDWRVDGESEAQRIPLAALDATTWQTELTLGPSASYAVVLTDAEGRDQVRSPRYRVEPAADRSPYLTLHLPQQDHDLYEDMMERVVADAADDYGFSSVRLLYRVDDGAERAESFRPFTPGQKEFRLDTLWDLSGLEISPGSVVSFYLEVKDNDTVSGPKAARSEVRRVRFPTLAEIYGEVAQEHDQEIDNLADVHEAQRDLREKLQKLSEDLKKGKDLNWDMQKDLEGTLERQASLESQVSEVVDRLQETLAKASDRAQMNQDLVQKMSELNKLLSNVANENLRRSFEKLSEALKGMERNDIRDALEDFQASQEQMLQGLDRTIELLKQIRKEEQVEDVVRRTDEIAELQEKIAEELRKMGADPEALQNDGQQPGDQDQAANQEQPQGDPAGEQAGEQQTGDPQKQSDEQTEQGKPQEGDQDGQQEGEQEGKQQDPSGEEESPSGEQSPGDQQEGEQQQGEQQQSGENQEGMTPEMEKLLDEMQQLQEQIADEQSKQESARNQQGEKLESATDEQLEKALEDLREQLRQLQEQNEKKSQQGDQQSSQSKQPQSQQSQGDQQEQQSQQKGEQSESGSPQEQERLKQLAREQQKVQEMVEELKRQLEMLKKLNQEDQALAQNLEKMEQGENTRQMEQSMENAQQGMQGGQQKEAAKYAFKARDEASRLAEMAESMQQQMQQASDDRSVEQMEAIIKGLIDVSGVAELITRSTDEDDRQLAARQYSLVERAQAVAESLQALSKESFAVDNQHIGKLGSAIDRMEKATRYFELGNMRSAQHEGRESAGDLNETIVELMKSHSQMCSGGQGQGSMQKLMEKMQGLSEAQQQVNQGTGKMSKEQQGKGRLNMAQEERLKWLAAQQEMIRQGLLEAQQEFPEARKLLTDLEKLAEEMEQVEGQLKNREVDQRLLERQQQILTRLLDAQRSIRQQEMSPERESRTSTLARRNSPPPIPEDLLSRERTLEEDVLRGSDDRYPSQFRRLVEDYFRALSRENRNP